MFVSVFDMFKVGVGPSSSHTMGPMVAAARFLDLMRASPFTFGGVQATLYGSLAFTGVGHATDRATVLGLAGFKPDSYDSARADAVLAQIATENRVTPDGLPPLVFDYKSDLIFDFDAPLPGHANGMILAGKDPQGDIILQETYYSVGGGFVLTADELASGKDTDDGAPVPYPFKSAAEMLEMCAETGKSIADLKRANELSRMGAAQLDNGLTRIWEVMRDCMDNGLSREGILPGGTHLVPLDACIETMRQTGNDMSEKYKETSLGGLAVNVPNC